MPVVLLYISGYIYEHEHCKDVELLVLLNVIFAISVVVLVVDKQVSTFIVMAVYGYGFVGMAIVGVMIRSVFLKAIGRVRNRTQARFDDLRQEQGAVSQSFLPN